MYILFQFIGLGRATLRFERLFTKFFFWFGLLLSDSILDVGFVAFYLAFTHYFYFPGAFQFFLYSLLYEST